MKTVYSILFCCLATVTLGEMASRYRDFLLRRHNEFRRNQFSDNFNRLRWNEDLAQQADEWLSNCEYNYDNNNGLGMNRVAFYTTDNDMDNMNQAFDDWSEQWNQYGYNNEECGDRCRYYQNVWYNTREVGCAINRCPQFSAYDRTYENAWFMGCWYSPRGNGMNAFMRDTPCEGEMCGDNFSENFEGNFGERFGEDFNMENFNEENFNNENFNMENFNMENWGDNFNMENWGDNFNMENWGDNFNMENWGDNFNMENWGCEDRRPNCMIWSARGMCNNNREYMWRYCPQTCGFCNGNQWFESYNFDNENCNNERPECETYGRQACRMPWMRQQCRRTCGTC